MKLCRCGCKKSDHDYSRDNGIHGGECKKCTYVECGVFVEKRV